MRVRLVLFVSAVIIFLSFVQFSYTVAKESWQQLDFDTTVKVQNHIPRKFDELFSIFSLLGSVEVTVGFILICAFLSLIRLKVWASLAWLLVLPATLFETFGKLVLFHPAPPVLFHRNILTTQLPLFYVHTNFSYPSGHLTRTAFIVTVLCLIVYFRPSKSFLKFFSLAGLLEFLGLMVLTRIYLGEHWLSDVIGGTLLGLSSGLLAAIFIINLKNHSLSKI